MFREAPLLNDKTIKSLKPKDKPYKRGDTDGLYLLISPAGSKCWRLKYRFNKKEKKLAIGVYPAVSLREAREKASEARKQLLAGVDPSHAKTIAKLSKAISAENTFQSVTHEWHVKFGSRWTKKHAGNVLKRMKADVFPYLGSKPINDITAQELLAVIRRIEERGAVDIAHRVLQTSGQILRYAIASGVAQSDISASLRGALTPLRKKHHAYLTEDCLPEFFSALDSYDGDPQTKRALSLAILTFVRTTELRNATWKEIDLDKAEWRIPPERMKMREWHIVPLSEEAVKILQAQKSEDRHASIVFPGQSGKKPISENTLLFALYRMGYHSRMTVHGFRATASTILNEQGFNRDVIERQLAHGERNKVRASYNHAQYLPERRKMMQWYARYLDSLGMTV